jgi:hypothetical protein
LPGRRRRSHFGQLSCRCTSFGESGGFGDGSFHIRAERSATDLSDDFVDEPLPFFSHAMPLPGRVSNTSTLRLEQEFSQEQSGDIGGDLQPMHLQDPEESRRHVQRGEVARLGERW